MPIGPVYCFPVVEERLRATSHNYTDVVQEVRLRATSHNYADVVIDLRTSATSHNYSYELGEFFQGLIRSRQLTEGSVEADRLESFAVQVLSQRLDVDLTETRLHNLYTVPTGETAFAIGLLIHARDADTVTVVPTVSLGATAGETDIFSQEAMTDFDTTDDFWSRWVGVPGKLRLSQSEETITLNVTGATATTLDADIYLLGFVV